jgi:hypothetical protein
LPSGAGTRLDVVYDNLALSKGCFAGYAGVGFALTTDDSCEPSPFPSFSMIFEISSSAVALPVNSSSIMQKKPTSEKKSNKNKKEGTKKPSFKKKGPKWVGPDDVLIGPLSF